MAKGFALTGSKALEAYDTGLTALPTAQRYGLSSGHDDVYGPWRKVSRGIQSYDYLRTLAAAHCPAPRLA